MCVRVVAIKHAKISYGSIIVAKLHYRLFATVFPIWYSGIRCIVCIVSYTIHTTSSSTIDATEDVYRITFRRNFEGSTLYGYCTLSIEWVFYKSISIKSTTGATTIYLCYLNSAIYIVLVIF